MTAPFNPAAGVVVPAPDAFLAFVQSRPADEAYDYTNTWKCPIARYCDFAGLDWLGKDELARGALEIGYGEQLSAEPQTYGALADRLEKVLGDAVPARALTLWAEPNLRLSRRLRVAVAIARRAA
jgi:hypothetical protein